MQIIKNISIEGSRNKPILVDIFFQDSGLPKPIIIFSHGFKGFKDWGHFNLMAQYFAEQGFVFVKFNFSHNGTTKDNPSEFGDLKTFGENNYIIELEDLGLVINHVLKNEKILKEINPLQIYLIGHSRGGAISILKAAEDKRVSKLVTWASVSDLISRNSEKTINEWKTKGVVYTFNARTKQNMPLTYQFYETIQKNKSRLDVLKLSAELKIPYLIIHGTNDEAVSDKDALALHKACRHSDLILINEAGHTFETRHPFNELNFPHNTKTLLEKTGAFLQE